MLINEIRTSRRCKAVFELDLRDPDALFVKTCLPKRVLRYLRMLSNATRSGSAYMLASVIDTHDGAFSGSRHHPMRPNFRTPFMYTKLGRQIDYADDLKR